MKKLFLLLLAVSAVFALVFTACEAAVNPDFVTQGYTKIEDPAVSAKAYEGAILVSWKPVKDAAAYTVTRKDNETLKVTALSPNYGTYGYLDVIGYNNELVHGRSYTYTVVASHDNSISASGGTVVDTPILNGKGETTVSAKVPADYTVPAIADFTTSEVTGVNGYDWLKVSWVAGTYNPAVNVRVTYSYGTAQPGLLTVSVPTINSTSTQGSSYALFPLIGGTNTVSVQPVFGSPASGDASLLGTYYASPAKVEKEVTSSKTSLGSLGTTSTLAYFNADPIVAAANPGDPGVALSYREFPGVEGATPSVYRLEITGYNANASTSLQTGATAAGWTAITPGFIKRSRTATEFEYYGEDLTVEAGKTYVYALVLSLDTAKSQAAVSSNITISKTTPRATISNFDQSSSAIAQVSILNSTGVTTGKRLQIRFTGDKTSTYKLQFAPNIGEDDSTNAKAGTYTDVPDAPTAVDPTGVITAAHNPPKRASYFYKVIGTNVDGVVNEVLYNATGSVPGLYSTSPWSSTDPISLTSLVTSTSKTSATNLRFVVPATGKAVTATTPDTLIFSGESVKIYYTPVDSGVELTQYTSSVTFTYANFTNDSDSTVRQKDITLSGENEFRSYSFKAFLVTESGKEIPLQ